jgi:hypothetical protein
MASSDFITELEDKMRRCALSRIDLVIVANVFSHGKDDEGYSVYREICLVTPKDSFNFQVAVPPIPYENSALMRTLLWQKQLMRCDFHPKCLHAIRQKDVTDVIKEVIESSGHKIETVRIGYNGVPKLRKDLVSMGIQYITDLTEESANMKDEDRFWQEEMCPHHESQNYYWKTKVPKNYPLCARARAFTYARYLGMLRPDRWVLRKTCM